MIYYDTAAIFIDGDHSGGEYTDHGTSGYQAQQYRMMAGTPGGDLFVHLGLVR